MNDHELRRLTGMITFRLWLVLLVVGAVGAGMAWVGIGIGMALLTLAVLILPIAVVATVAFASRRPAPVLARWLLWAGLTLTVGGLAWLLIQWGQAGMMAVIIFAVGIWLVVVGLIATVAVAVLRS